MKTYLVFFAACLIGFLTSCAPEVPATESTSTPFFFAEDGAWCWFQDPRAVYVDGERTRTYAGWMTSTGQLKIGAFDHRSRALEHVTLKENWDVDDHNAGTFLVLPDNRLAVFYARHNREGLFLRVSTHPEDISSWEEEVTVSDSDRITYSHPVYLSEEQRYYVFWRGPSWKPTFSTSMDLKTWSEPQILIQEEGREARDIRPYLKVVSDGVSTIHFAFTNGHPRNEATNSLYYLKYRAGRFYNVEGMDVGAMSEVPIRIGPRLLVYDATETGHRAWVWDIAVDEEGFPVIAYTRLPAETDHRYHYARWDGAAWVDTEITPAGPWFPQTPSGEEEREGHYSGGIGIHPGNPSTVYLSRQVAGQFEIEKWTTSDAGKTWQGAALTRASQALNVRPVVPRGYQGDEDLMLWMQGNYVHYTDYHTAIRMLTPGIVSEHRSSTP